MIQFVPLYLISIDISLLSRVVAIHLLNFSELSPPQNISVVPLSPTTLRVFWSPSTTESVNYQVFWRWEGIVEGKTHIQSGDLHSPGDRDIIKWADMSDLKPGQEYVLWVSLNSFFVPNDSLF